MVALAALAIITTGIQVAQAATWTWFSYKTIKAACQVGNSLIHPSKKGRHRGPKFQSGKVDKFYKGVKRQARPRILRNNEKLAERMKEAIKEGETVTLIPTFHDTVSKSRGPMEIKEEMHENTINAMVISNFGGCKNDCDCSNGNVDGSHSSLTLPEKVLEQENNDSNRSMDGSPANLTSPEENVKFSAAMIAEKTVQELQTLWEQSPEDLCNESDIVLETPAKYTRVKTGIISNLFEESILANRFADDEFETLRNSTPAVLPGIKCDFELSSKIKSHSILKTETFQAKTKKRPHALHLLQESDDSFSSINESQLAEEWRAISHEDSEANEGIGEDDFHEDSEANEGIGEDDATNSPDHGVSSLSQSPILRKQRENKLSLKKRKQMAIEKDFSDIVYEKMVTSAKRKVTVGVVNVLDVLENSKEDVDLLKEGGSISSREITLLLTPTKHESLTTSDPCPSEISIQDPIEVGDYRDPLRVWTPTAHSVIPPWNKDLLPSESLPASLDKTPPTPPRVDISLLACLENFDNEEPKPTTVEEIILEKDELIELNDVQDLSDAEEVVVNYDNFCFIRTTPAAIKKSRKSEERNETVETGLGFNTTQDLTNWETDMDIIDVDAMGGEVDVMGGEVGKWEQLLGDPAMADASTTSGTYEDVSNSAKTDANMKSVTNADGDTSNMRLSLGVSYDLLNPNSTKDDSRTDDEQADSTAATFDDVFDEATIMSESINDDIFYDTTKKVTEIDVIEGDEAGDVDDKDAPYSREEVPCDAEEDEDVILMAMVFNKEVPLESIKIESNDDEEETNTDLSKENLTNMESHEHMAAKEWNEDQEIIMISDDEAEPVESGSVAVSDLERCIVTDLKLQINSQFEVEEIDE